MELTHLEGWSKCFTCQDDSIGGIRSKSIHDSIDFTIRRGRDERVLRRAAEERTSVVENCSLALRMACINGVLVTRNRIDLACTSMSWADMCWMKDSILSACMPILVPCVLRIRTDLRAFNFGFLAITSVNIAALDRRLSSQPSRCSNCTRPMAAEDLRHPHVGSNFLRLKRPVTCRDLTMDLILAPIFGSVGCNHPTLPANGYDFRREEREAGHRSKCTSHGWCSIVNNGRTMGLRQHLRSKRYCVLHTSG